MMLYIVLVRERTMTVMRTFFVIQFVQLEDTRGVGAYREAHHDYSVEKTTLIDSPTFRREIKIQFTHFNKSYDQKLLEDFNRTRVA